jgi:hypothetical protein
MSYLPASVFQKLRSGYNAVAAIVIDGDRFDCWGFCQ